MVAADCWAITDSDGLAKIGTDAAKSVARVIFLAADNLSIGIF